MMAFCVRNTAISSRCWSKSTPLNRVLQQCRTAFWSRKDKEEPELPEHVQPRKAIPGEDRHMVERLNLLAVKSKLTNLRPYTPPTDVEARVQKLTLQACDVQGEDWRTVSLEDSRLKYKLLTKLIKEFDHDIPNVSLFNIKTVDDAVTYFQTQVRDTSTIEDMSKLDLPKNLNIRTEYHRFDPETDTMFGGRTAYPGHDTHVTSLKYRRKYKDIKTTEDKPGYVNHYHGY